MDYEGLDTTQLLRQWNAGDGGAVDALVRRHESWIRRRVRSRLGTDLRRKLDSADVVQEALLRFFVDGPRVHIANEECFRRLMAVIVENVIRDESDWFRARRRDMRRELDGQDEAVVYLDARRPGEATALEQLERAEQQAMIRLGLELMRPEDRMVYVLRIWDELSFAAVAQRLGIREDAADARFRRAARRLQEIVASLRERGVDPLIERLERGDDDVALDGSGNGREP